MTVGFPPRPLLGASGAATELGQGRQVAAAMAMAVADGRKGAEGGGEKTEGLVPTAEETWVAAAWAAVVKAQEGQVMGVVVRRAEAATGPEAWARAVGAARARGAPGAEGAPAALPPVRWAGSLEAAGTVAVAARAAAARAAAAWAAAVRAAVVTAREG